MAFRKKGTRSCSRFLPVVVPCSLIVFGTAYAAGGGHGGDRTADLLDLLYRFINFALMVIILIWAIKKAGLKESLAVRIEGIRQRMETLRAEREESKARYLELEQKIKNFEKEKVGILEQFRKEGEAEKERIISEARKRAKQMVEQSGLIIEREIQSAKESLQREVMNLAAERAQEVIRKTITDQDQDRLVSEFIGKVEKIH